MAYLEINPIMIQGIARSGLAYNVGNGIWIPVAHCLARGNMIVSVNNWVAEQKPAIARRVIQANPVPKVKDPNLTVGAYRLGDEIFVLRMSKKSWRNGNKRSIYALQMVAINGERLMLSDTVQKVDFKYTERAKSAIYELHLEHKLPIEDQESITIRYGACMICGRGLKDATSVSEGIGPVCYESMTGIKPSERKKMVARRRAERERELRDEMREKATDVMHYAGAM